MVGLLVALGAGERAHAITISTLGETSGGNPGGQTLYEVTGLSQGDSFNVDWFYSGGGITLSATGMITVRSLSSTELILDIMIVNTTSVQGSLTAPITVFGLAADGFTALGHYSQVDNTSGSNLANAMTGNFPGFDIDACASSNGNNCASGDPNTGIWIGDSDVFYLELEGMFDSTAALSLFALKWQTSLGSFELAGIPSYKGGPTQVSEPGSLILLAFALGLLSLGAGARRGRAT